MISGFIWWSFAANLLDFQYTWLCCGIFAIGGVFCVFFFFWREQLELRKLVLHGLSQRRLLLNETFKLYSCWTHLNRRGLDLPTENKLERGLIWPQHTQAQAFLRGIDVWLSPWVIEFQVAFPDAAADCVKWKGFYEVLPSPCGYIYHKSMMVSRAMPAKGSKASHIQQRFPALPCTDWDFSRFQESFHNIMYCMYFIYNSLKVWHKQESHDLSLLAKSEPLVYASFIPNHDTLTCGMFQMV